MLLLRSWKESLSLFVPKNFKLFLLATLKSTLDLYGFLVYYFWWLILGVIVLHMSCYYPECSLKGVTWLGIEALATLALFFVIAVLARSSISLKDYDYVKNQLMKSGFGFLCIYGVFELVNYYGVLWTSFILSKFKLPGLVAVPIYLFFDFIHFYAPILIMPPALFSLLFFLDSHGTLQEIVFSIARGIKMFIFNFPFCFFSMVLIFFFWIGIISLFDGYEMIGTIWLFNGYGMQVFFSFIPFLVSYFKNMYVKRVHDQFNLYFAA